VAGRSVSGRAVGRCAVAQSPVGGCALEQRACPVGREAVCERLLEERARGGRVRNQ